MAMRSFTVNGQTCQAEGTFIAYEEVVRLAKLTGTPTATYHASYAHYGPGSFIPNQSVTLEEGMAFTVVHTNLA